MLAYINQTIPVPNASLIDVQYEHIGDGDYTALGTYRQDSITVKRIWLLEATHLTKTEYDAIVDHLLNNKFGTTDFWLDEFSGSSSGNSVDAFVSISSDERTPFQQSTQGHTIELEVREK